MYFFKTNLAIVFTLLITISLPAQSDKDLKPVFIEAEAFFFYEEYEEALPLYLTLIKEMPYNFNVVYRAGVCYLNIPYSKHKAVKYLEEASGKINTEFKKSKFKEIGAPPEALFYLGEAYRVNRRYREAVQAYNEFLDYIDLEVYSISRIHLSIAAAQNAMAFENRHQVVEKENLGEPVNSSFNERNAIVSGNGKMIVFTRELQFYDAAFFAYKGDDGNWEEPQNFMPVLKVDNDLYPTSVSYDGTEVYFYRNDEFDGNIYMTSYKNGAWQELRKLNDNINTKYWESHASINKEGDKLYFTSNRENEGDNLDIFVSQRLPDGEWDVPEKLGIVVNSPFNENTPFISPDGKTLYFSSEGHLNTGGYDIFCSELVDGEWSKPQNMGYPINSPDDDLFFVPAEIPNTGYMVLQENTSLGRSDVYKIKILD